RDEPRGQSDPNPGQQPERAGGLGADIAQTGWRRVFGRAGPGREGLGGCAAGFRTTGEWSSHDIVPFLSFAVTAVVPGGWALRVPVAGRRRGRRGGPGSTRRW